MHLNLLCFRGMNKTNVLTKLLVLARWIHLKTKQFRGHGRLKSHKLFYIKNHITLQMCKSLFSQYPDGLLFCQLFISMFGWLLCSLQKEINSGDYTILGFRVKQSNQLSYVTKDESVLEISLHTKAISPCPGDDIFYKYPPTSIYYRPPKLPISCELRWVIV